MTTNVTIEAHCQDDIEVQVILMDNRTIVDSAMLKDGETKEVHVYDSREVLVKEVRRFQPPADEPEPVQPTNQGGAEAEAEAEAPA